jgi:hypothetical protein
MRVSWLASAALFALTTLAFPANLIKGDIDAEALAEITSFVSKITQDMNIKQQGGPVKRAFDADAQRVSTTGEHAYVRRIVEITDVVCCG